MKFNQSRMATKINFNFEEDYLEYQMSDNQNELDFEVEYGKIPKKSQRFYERNEWLRNVGLLWIALGVGFSIWNFIDTQALRVNFWVYVGLACLVFYRFTWSEYDYFDTEEGRILVLNDKNSKLIIDEIKNRRKAAYHAWFDRLNFHGDSNEAKATLDYMVKEKAMTRAEADQRLAFIESDGKPRLVSSKDDETPKLH